MSKSSLPYVSDVQLNLTASGDYHSVLLSGFELDHQPPHDNPFAFRNLGFTLKIEDNTPIRALKVDLRWLAKQTDGATTTLIVSVAGDVNTVTLDGEHDGGETETYEVEFEEPVTEGELHILLTAMTQVLEEEDFVMFTVETLDFTLVK
jgi:hypothetical protein